MWLKLFININILFSRIAAQTFNKQQIERNVSRTHIIFDMVHQSIFEFVSSFSDEIPAEGRSRIIRMFSFLNFCLDLCGSLVFRLSRLDSRLLALLKPSLSTFFVWTTRIMSTVSPFVSLLSQQPLQPLHRCRLHRRMFFIQA